MIRFNFTLLHIIHTQLLGGFLVLASGCAMNLPYLPYEKKSEPSTAPELEITFLGNSTLYFESKGGNSILIDGFVSRPSLLPMLTGLDYKSERIKTIFKDANIQLDGNDYIIPLHSHYDHLLDAPYIAYDSGATLFASKTTERIARGIEEGLKKTSKEQGEPEKSIYITRFSLASLASAEDYQNDAFKITLEKAKHNCTSRIAQWFAPLCDNCELDGSFSEKRSSKAFKEGISVNVHLYHKATGKRIYVMGGLPSDYMPNDSKASSNLMDADIVFLTVPVLKYEFESQEEWGQFFDDLADKPKTIVPVHWDVFLRELSIEECNSKDLSHCLLAMPNFKKTIERLNHEVKSRDNLSIKWMTGFSTLSILSDTKPLAHLSEESCEK